MKPERVLEILTALLMVGALCLGGLVIAREFFPDQFRGSRSGAPPPRATRWILEPGLIEELANTGWRSGDPHDSTAVTIIEFSDFQCPACRLAAIALRQVVDEQPGRVILSYHHNPLERIHPHAFAAGVAFECAVEQGRGQQMYDTLFAGQTGIGTSPWSVYAAGADVPDSVRFNACLNGQTAPARVRADAEMARSLGFGNTPTFVIGRSVVIGAVGADSIRALVRAARNR